MLDRLDWQFANSFAPWLSAAGTITAATVALFLAHRNVRINLQAQIENEPGETLGVPLQEPFRFKSYLTVRIVNTGPRDITISRVQWQDGWIVTRHCEMLRHADSSSIPARLRDGDEIALRFEPHDFYHYLLARPRSIHPSHIGQWRIRFDLILRKYIPFSSVRARIHTSTGRSFNVRVPREVECEFADFHSVSDVLLEEEIRATYGQTDA